MKHHVIGSRVLFLKCLAVKNSALKSVKIVAGLAGRVGIDVLLWFLSHFDDLIRFQVILFEVLTFLTHAVVVVFG